MEEQIHCDVLIIGAGPAGSVGAAILRKKGLSVKIVEKQQFPRFVIGESLLPRCMDSLEKAGLIEAIERFGFQKKYGAKFLGQNQICEFEFSTQYTNGYSWTWQVQRAKFDKVLADEVEKMGAELVYNAEVQAIAFRSPQFITTTILHADGKAEKVNSKFVLDASGYGRVLAKLLKLDKPSTSPDRTSIFTHIAPTNSQISEERKQIIIVSHTDGIWAWVIPFLDGTTSIGIVGLTSDINKFKGDTSSQMRNWIAEIPDLHSRFATSEFLFEPKLISGYSSGVTNHFGKGFVLTGNSAEFIDPIFSSGTTFAVESSALAAELIAKELAGEIVNWEKDYTNYIQNGVDVFRSFINFWYDGTLQKIFFSDSRNEETKKQICSILAGYVWDETNPLVVKHTRAIPTLARLVE